MNSDVASYQSTKNLDYSDYNFSEFGFIKPPKPSLNANLYTGEPFHKDALYKDYPVIPDSTYMNNVNLRSANPPPNAIDQYTDTIRPGNNSQVFTNIERFSDNTNIVCGNQHEHTPLPTPCSYVHLSKNETDYHPY